MPNKSIKYIIPLILLLISCSSNSSIISSSTTSSISSSITNDLDLSIFNSTPLEDELDVYGYKPIYKDSTFKNYARVRRWNGSKWDYCYTRIYDGSEWTNS